MLIILPLLFLLILPPTLPSGPTYFLPPTRKEITTKYIRLKYNKIKQK